MLLRSTSAAERAADTTSSSRFWSGRIFASFGAAFLLALLLSGCSGSSRIGGLWTDFNSYFNTFYNAQQSYKRGYEQYEDQKGTLNPERPIRVHRSPLRGGVNHFEDAIERGTDLLINHPNSRYVDDAVALIGRSYFFLQNYYSAEQKFIELYAITGSDDLLQESVIWRGRTMLEQERYNEGISYMNAQLEASDIEWDRRSKAEAEILLAQFMVELEQYEEAGRLLFTALPDVKERELRARGFFLNGQLLDMLEAYEPAYEAFDRAASANPYYELIYHAELKKGVMLRKLGRNAEARRHFASMSRDNNNFEFLSEIQFQLGLTQQAMGNDAAALEWYREVLYLSNRTPGRELLARTHYAKAELYRFSLQNYPFAAAHYDTASRNASNIEMLPVDFDARDMASSFGEFSRLNQELIKQDSLLYLGELPPAQFDSTIAVIQQEYSQRMRAAERQRQRESNRMVSIDPEDVGQAAETDENGFLFHLNRQLANQASIQFLSLWSGRPLVDNWRREQDVRAAIVRAEEQEEEEESAEQEEIIYVEETTVDEYQLDLSEIPRSRVARAEMRQRMAETKYQIGNLYFLSLNQPDSARTYFEDVIENHGEADIMPQAMYSLSEILYESGREDSAREWAYQIADRHPGTLYARRLTERFNLDVTFEDVAGSPEEAFTQRYYELLNELDGYSLTQAADSLLAFGKADTLTSHAPEALYSAARKYITQGQQQEGFSEARRRYEQLEEQTALERQELESLKDSARSKLAELDAAERATVQQADEEEENPAEMQQEAPDENNDGAPSDSLRTYWQGVIDSTIHEPAWHEIFPYTGQPWDKAREALTLITENHNGFRYMNRVRPVLEELKKPQPPEPEPEPEEAPEEETEAETASVAPAETNEETEAGTVYQAEEINAIPEIVGGREALLRDSGLLEHMQELNILEAQFSLRLHVSAEGNVTRAVPISEPDEFGMMQRLREHIILNTMLEPVRNEGRAVPVIYEYDLFISQDDF